MGRTACTEPQSLHKGDLYLYFTAIMLNIQVFWETYAMLTGKQSSFFHCLNLKLKALRTSETSRTTYRMIQHHIPEDRKAPYFLLFFLNYWPCHLLIYFKQNCINMQLIVCEYTC